MENDPSRRLLLLGDIVQDFGYVDRKDFRIVKCRRQEAYGCGQNGDAIARGLSLFVHLGREDDPHSHPKMCISASNEVFERIGLEIEDRKAKIYGRDIRLSGRIYTVDGNVMVLRVSFVASFRPTDFRSYYLVYDSAAESLILLSRRPHFCRPICTTLPLKVGEDKYSLVLMSEMEVTESSSAKRRTPVLCLWSPNKRRDYSRCPWDVKDRERSNAEPFEANVVFVFKGNAVWANLAQGVLYCDCNDLIDGTRPVDFKHIMLPKDCRITDDFDLDRPPMRVHRNMGCVGDSIWFVIIEPNYTCPGDTVVKVWTLDILSEEKWNLHREFKMLELFKSGLLPETVPKFPIFRHHDDGSLHVLLPETYKGGHPYGHLVCIDLGSSSSSCIVRLRSIRRLALPLMDYPVVLDPSFFDTKPV